MKVDFEILSAFGVPENYIWDKGIPYLTEAVYTSAFTTQNYVSGYAPGLAVRFKNTSIPEEGFDNINFEWNFGDYYNDTTNTAVLTTLEDVEHNYILPGVYTVSLKLNQTRSVEELDETGNSLLCRGKYNYRWFWDETNCGKETALTWDQINCGEEKEKQWDDELGCFEKYCKIWSWKDLSDSGQNPVKWNQSSTDADFVKKWYYEVNDSVCSVENADFLSTTNSLEQTVIKSYIVELVETPPIASICCVTTPLTGYSPFTVRLTPRFCKTGSFPIDRIDWDFGDGSPIKTISRYTVLTGSEVIYTDALPVDPPDVRNYDVLHTYRRFKNTYPVFYPSLTCYSSSTNTSDACSIPIGPIALSSISSETHLIKNRNTLKGNIYTVGVGKNISFLTTQEQDLGTVAPNIPPNVIRNGCDGPPLGYYGNPGDVYPFGDILPPRYITTEDSTPEILYDNLGDNGVPINTEENLIFVP